jgi:lipopolysaccharide heptosyltransferase II
MNIRTMKALDHFVGIPLCLLLDGYQILRQACCRDQPRPLRRILVMKFFGIGSILLSSPMLRAIKERHPEVRIGFLTFAGNQGMVERLGLTDTLYTLRTDSLPHFALDLLRALRLIRRERYDATIDMEFFSKFSTIVTYLAKSPVRIGYFLRQMWRGHLLTEAVYYNHYKHITEVFGALAAPLGVTIEDYRLQTPQITPDEESAAEALLARAGVKPQDTVIAFNVNASDLSLERRWSKENFLSLARGLLTDPLVRLIFIGSPAEAPYVAATVAQLPGDGRVIDLAGKTRLAELLGVLKRCQLLITNDSGPLHLACALGVATVSFFGPETPMLYGPRTEGDLVFYEGIYCSPCLNVFNVKTAPCHGHNVCMQGISPATALHAIRAHFTHLRERRHAD